METPVGGKYPSSCFFSVHSPEHEKCKWAHWEQLKCSMYTGAHHTLQPRSDPFITADHSWQDMTGLSSLDCEISSTETELERLWTLHLQRWRWLFLSNTENICTNSDRVEYYLSCWNRKAEDLSSFFYLFLSSVVAETEDRLCTGLRLQDFLLFNSQNGNRRLVCTVQHADTISNAWGWMQLRCFNLTDSALVHIQQFFILWLNQNKLLQK